MIKIRSLLKHNQKGIGLLELMLSLAIIAILLVMATRYYLTASLSSSTNEVVSNLQGATGCVENWRQAYMWGSTPKTYNDFKLSDCVKNDWFPAASAYNDNLVTPWGAATITTSVNDIIVKIRTTKEQQAKSLYIKLGGDINKWRAGTTEVDFSIIQQKIVSPV
jgi:prepilin-type N-terminal cleavage/methylation domain-containing protein